MHLAAVKQVALCELLLMGTVKTNLIRAGNLLELALKNEIKRVGCLR